MTGGARWARFAEARTQPAEPLMVRPGGADVPRSRRDTGLRPSCDETSSVDNSVNYMDNSLIEYVNGSLS